MAGLNANWSTHLTGAEEPSPAPGVVVETDAQGHAIFLLSKDGLSLDYRLIAANISNVTQAHIHVGPPGVNGPIGVWLYPSTSPPANPAGGGPHDGPLAAGTITAANLIGPLATGILLNNAVGQVDDATILRTFWVAAAIMLVAFLAAVYFEKVYGNYQTAA